VTGMFLPAVRTYTRVCCPQWLNSIVVGIGLQGDKNLLLQPLSLTERQ